jgi:transcriptional antiterminator NusG
MNNNDDNKDLNTEEEVIETTTPDAATAVDVSPVGEEPEKATPEVAAEITEELAEQIDEELEDSDNGDETPAQHAAEEEVAAAVEEENEAAMEAEGVDAPTETVDETTVDEASVEEDPKDSNPNAKWYVVHTYSGHENRVATNLRQRIETEGLEHKIVDILVPTQDKIEIRGGKKEQVKEKLFPGYMYVKMELDNSTWIAVRTTQGVIGFVGAGTKPMPISDSEVKSIMQFMNQGAAPTFKEVFNVDDPVKIIDGPFADFIGKIETVDKEKGKVRVLVSIFGRETPVELDFLQVSKL